ncbi:MULTISPECIES: hemerythrin domain-containing protein [unclassified Streptomyces]|uniref:hemerythrin domain-containing protein n=1 Tax=unclassified Streptomyces TaxID=2593676 RepID=UPI0033A7D0CB
MASSTSGQSPAPQSDSGFGGFDAQDMRIVHRVFRREIRLLGEMIAAVAPGDVKRAAVLAEHLADVRMGLIHHHEGEDELLWPLMLTRVGLERDVVLRMEAEHERIVESLAAVDTLATRWAPTADAETRDLLVAALEEHRTVLVEHLDDEEAHLLPLAERFLTAKEFDALGDHFVQNTPKSKLLKFFGMVMEDADERERALMLGGLPAPVRVLWRLLGPPLYARTLRRVRATA